MQSGMRTHFGVIILNYTKVVRKEARKDKPKTVREKWKRYEDKGFPDGPVVKNLPANAGDMGLNLVQELRSPKAHEPQLLKPAPQSLCSTKEASARKSRHTTTRE